MADSTFSFEKYATLELVKRPRQKNLRIRIKNNRVIVSAPSFCSKQVIMNFIRNHEDWAVQALEKQSRQQLDLKDAMKARQSELLIRGEWKPIRVVVSDIPINRVSFKESRESINCYLSPKSRILKDQVRIKQLTNAWLKDVAKFEIRERFEIVAANFDFKWIKIFIRSQKTKWGTCSSKGNLSFNWRIIKAPIFVWDYLIIHELCHTVHMNHSRQYWALVDSLYPDRKKAERWLKQHEAFVFAESEL